MTTSVRALADKVFAYQIDESWYLQLRRGRPVERMRVESDESTARDARFAEQVLAELRATEPVDEDDRLTAGYLEFTLSGQVAAAETPLLGFTVTPYQSCFVGM